MLRVNTTRCLWRWAGVAGLVTLASCAPGTAAPPSPSPSPTAAAPLRVLVKLRSEAPPEAIAAQVGRSAGVPARYEAATSPLWHALTLACAPAECDAALQRLAADSAHFDAVQRDAHRRVGTP